VHPWFQISGLSGYPAKSVPVPVSGASLISDMSKHTDPVVDLEPVVKGKSSFKFFESLISNNLKGHSHENDFEIISLNDY
jgi:hypothetical protein